MQANKKNLFKIRKNSDSLKVYMKYDCVCIAQIYYYNIMN